ncbi:MAG: hypothetical protein KAS32_12180 [Candidatus Peribacteraceae bacterium]|nr:hypothetical protein [Candidatus Peribacteraceae bacterium]
MEIIFKAIPLIIFIGLASSAFLNPILPKWFCKYMGWHLAPKEVGFDGCSNTGKCPRCNESVMQDSQGNWF